MPSREISNHEDTSDASTWRKSSSPSTHRPHPGLPPRSVPAVCQTRAVNSTTRRRRLYLGGSCRPPDGRARAGRPAHPSRGVAAPRGRRRGLAGLGHRRAPDGVRRAWDRGARGDTRRPRPTPRTPASTSYSPPARRPASRSPTSCRPSRRSAKSRGSRGERGATVLYLAPTKALAQDQLAGLAGARARRPGHDPRRRQPARAARLDPRPRRVRPDQPRHAAPLAAARAQPMGRLPGVAQYVVVDECHHYRGVFGAHVAHVLRRLRRVCALYGAHPTFVLASATMAEPAVTAGRLTGLDVLAVTDDESPRGQVALALWEPPFTSCTGENGAPVRRAASSETADLLADLVAEDVRTLAFVRSRRGAEQVAMTAAEPPRRGRPVPAGSRGGVPRRLPARGAPRASRRRCAPATWSVWPPPTRSSWASTSAVWTPC